VRDELFTMCEYSMITLINNRSRKNIGATLDVRYGEDRTHDDIPRPTYCAKPTSIIKVH
jgi:hypothetical protein